MTNIKLDLSGLKALQQSVKKGNAQGNKVMVGIISEAKNTENSTLVQDYAMYLEYGWVQSVTTEQKHYLTGATHHGIGSTLYNPPRPIFRCTYEKYSDIWIDEGRRLFNNLMKNPLNFDKAMNLYLKFVGQRAVQDLQKTIASHGSEFNFPKRSPLTIAMFEALHNGRKPSQGVEPLVNTGALLRSISFEIIK